MTTDSIFADEYVRTIAAYARRGVRLHYVGIVFDASMKLEWSNN